MHDRKKFAMLSDRAARHRLSVRSTSWTPKVPEEATAATYADFKAESIIRENDTMAYIDGFVAAVPTRNRDAYRKHAEMAAPVFREHGALKLVECWGDDVPEGKLTSFPMAVQKKDDETVVFSWIVWPSRQSRDEGMKKVMADPRIQPDVNPMPFDAKRLIFGGFEVLVDA
jgi:uncharacterized protein YbaA (DUF1428 family)